MDRPPDRSVAERLRRLRGQPSLPDPSPAVEATAGMAGPPSFAERVRRLMVGPAMPAPREPDEGALAEAIGAQSIAPGVLLLERRLGARIRHGRQLLVPGWGDSGAPSHLPEMAGMPDQWSDGAVMPCFFDTETSGLAGGTGTWAFLTGILTCDAEGWRLRQYLLTRLDGEVPYLEAVAQAMAEAAPLVSYNGRAFDVPLLTTRFRLSGQTDPFRDRPHLDLLSPVRRAFGRVWPDCRLISAETRLLGFTREGDLPGSAAPAAWLGWLRSGEIGPLAGVLRHNRWDLLSLAGLVPVLDRVFQDPAACDADSHAVASYHATRGRAELAVRLLESARGDLSSAGLLDLARLYRRRGDWIGAIQLWEGLAAEGDARARSALAKYHEHQTRDLDLALAFASDLPAGPERERRCERLRGKLAGR